MKLFMAKKLILDPDTRGRSGLSLSLHEKFFYDFSPLRGFTPLEDEIIYGLQRE